MKLHRLIHKAALAVALFLSLNVALRAQSISGVEAIPPNTPDVNPTSKWVINVSFVSVPIPTKIKQRFLVDVDDAKIIPLEDFRLSVGDKNTYTANAGEPLEMATPKKGECLKFKKHYEFRASVENEKGDKVLSLGAGVDLLDENCSQNDEVKVKAKSADDADVYLSGELNGAHKRKTSFTTEIKLQRYSPISANWRHTPFFTLNASTDPDADPDKMELGWAFRYVANSAYFDHKVKLESERDFGNTNLIYDTRFTFLPTPRPKGKRSFKIFPDPFIGGEFGKNLRSPLKAAEGDGIARLLIGADVRLAFWVKKDSDEPDINWTTSFVRRWLLTDELSFEADKDGKLQLRRFGTNPRDYVSSKVSYKLSKFLNVFVEYEWGQVPPSYKLVDHRFRLGLAYKYKFGVK